jgi:hypothetical protein
MNAAEILIAVQQAGATLRVEGHALVATHASRIAPAIKSAIRENKPQIIAALAKPVCAVCNAPDDLWHLDSPTGPVSVHQECAEFLPKLEAAEPTAAYQATSADPDGIGCSVQIVEIPRAAGRYRRTFAHLQLRPPAMVDVARWGQCIEDGKRFLGRWAEVAQRLNWSSADLFGLAPVPDRPHPSYSRLSRHNAVALIWLLVGREIVAITSDTATIKNPTTGTITTYRRHHKPALGPLGDSLLDLD